MAETALSMARSILGSAISKAASAAADEMSLLMGVQKEIWFMKDEMKTMQAFLIAAERLKKKKPLLKVWAEQVRSLSYDVEDCLDEFKVHVGSQSLKQQLKKLKHRHRIAVQIRNLKSRVEEVSSRNSSQELRMLRILDLKNAHFAVTQKDISNIGLLRHLKYVNIGCCRGYSSIYTLPRSIGKLQDLQTLQVRGSYISTLPTEICKLKCLRTLYFSSFTHYSFFNPSMPMQSLKHLLCLPKMFTPLVDSSVRNKAIAELHKAYSSCWSQTNAVKVPRGIGGLKGLQILGKVHIKRTSIEAIEELGELSKLRKLTMNTQGATENKCMTLRKAIEKLQSIDCLFIDARRETAEWVGSVSSLPSSLRNLTLLGPIGDKIDWFSNLTRLVKLHLQFSEIKEDKSVEILGALPNLMVLYLYSNAYAGKELVFRQGTFQNLRKLHIWSQENLREIRFEKDASPMIESIDVRDGFDK